LYFNVKELKIKINPDNSLAIEISFFGKENLKKEFYNSEFTILKGTVKSLCLVIKRLINKLY